MKYLAFIAVILFCSGYWICNLFFENGSIHWWNLRISIYTIIFALCFTVGYLLTDGVTKSVFLTGIVFCAGDIADRYYFKINEFNFNDLLLYLFAFYHIYKTYARQIKGTAR